MVAVDRHLLRSEDDIVDVALEGVDHIIDKPREVFVEENGLDLSSLAIIDADDTRQVVVLKDPMMLPDPGSARKAS